MSSQIYNFTVVGSGTAGWLTALYIQKYYPFTKVRVISSSDIGILGAGEGTTPNVMAALEHLGIPFEGLFKRTKATVKNGIEFTDWNGDGESYFNGFSNHDNFNPFKFNNVTGQMLPILALEPIGYGRNINEIFIDSKLNESNRVKYTPNQNINNKMRIIKIWSIPLLKIPRVFSILRGVKVKKKVLTKKPLVILGILAALHSPKDSPVVNIQLFEDDKKNFLFLHNFLPYLFGESNIKIDDNKIYVKSGYNGMLTNLILITCGPITHMKRFVWIVKKYQ